MIIHLPSCKPSRKVTLQGSILLWDWKGGKKQCTTAVFSSLWVHARTRTHAPHTPFSVNSRMAQKQQNLGFCSLSFGPTLSTLMKYMQKGECSASSGSDVSILHERGAWIRDTDRGKTLALIREAKWSSAFIGPQVSPSASWSTSLSQTCSTDKTRIILVLQQWSGRRPVVDVSSLLPALVSRGEVKGKSLVMSRKRRTGRLSEMEISTEVQINATSLFHLTRTYNPFRHVAPSSASWRVQQSWKNYSSAKWKRTSSFKPLHTLDRESAPEAHFSPYWGLNSFAILSLCNNTEEWIVILQMVA